MNKLLIKRIIRGFWKNKVFTFINLAGIAVGLSVAFFAVNYLLFEFGYDKFHSKSDEIFRLAWSYRNQAYSINSFPNNEEENSQLNWINTLKNTSGVADATQFMIAPSKEFVELDQKRIETDAILTTNTAESFTKIFDWEIVAGSFKSFYEGTNKVILTESIANKLVGSSGTFEELINKSVKIVDKDVLVAAIIKDVPKNSHFDFSLALNLPKIDYWGSRVYVETLPRVDVEVLTKNLNQTIASFNPKQAQDPLYKGHFLQAIEDIHFKSNILYESKQPGIYTYIFLLSLFTVFTLFITIFNYSNLNLAIKSKQNKAIGVLKTMGAKSENLATEFLIEAIVLSILAIPFAILFIFFVTPFFNDLMGVDINPNFVNNFEILMMLIGLALFIGLIASLAPIVFIAGKNAILLFKDGLQKINFQGLIVRKYLIIAQFVFLVSIISIAFFTSQQISFINSKDLGFRKSNLVFAYTSPENQDIFQQKLRGLPGITHVGNGSNFGTMPFNQMTYKLENQETVFDDARQLYLDAGAIAAYGIKTDLKFDKDSPRKNIINRTAAQKLAKAASIPIERLIGKTIITEPEYTNPESGQRGIPIVIDGIFEDIHLFSLKEKIEPYFIVLSNSIRMDGRTIISYESPDIIQKIQEVYKDLNEPFPLEISYIEENLKQLYEQENKLNILFKTFGFLSIFVASLGLIGITVFLTSIRTKEIGIRKILGASAFSITVLSVREYIPLILVSTIISSPLIYFIMDQWLSGFAYQYDIQYFLILPICFAVLGLIMFFVGGVSFRAALMNPVKSLKVE